MDRIASHAEQLLDWLDRHIFPAEKAFAERAHANAVAAAFLDELLRNGTTSARRTRIVSGKVLMDLGPEGLADTVDSGQAESKALIRRWHGCGRLGYAVTPRFALRCSSRRPAAPRCSISATGSAVQTGRRSLARYCLCVWNAHEVHAPRITRLMAMPGPIARRVTIIGAGRSLPIVRSSLPRK